MLQVLLSPRFWLYGLKPSIWPELYRRLQRKIGGRQSKQHAAAGLEAAKEAGLWCDRHSMTEEQALDELGLQGPILDVGQLFSEDLAAAHEAVDKVPMKLGGASNMNLIYTLCEALGATRVIETGVANGWSSLAILLSIATRPGAALHSVDLPYLQYQNDPWVGVAVPKPLHLYWTLYRMADREGLPKALDALGTIDFAHYDSDKSLDGRRFAYPLLWQALAPGGLLFSDDINDNFGFRDFCDSIGQQPVIVRQDNKFQGILRKPVMAPATP